MSSGRGLKFGVMSVISDHAAITSHAVPLHETVTVYVSPISRVKMESKVGWVPEPLTIQRVAQT